MLEEEQKKEIVCGEDANASLHLQSHRVIRLSTFHIHAEEMLSFVVIFVST